MLTDLEINVKTTAVCELAEHKKWLCWQYDKDKKKVPVNIRTGKGLKEWTHSSAWVSYKTALANSSRYSGIGFVFSEQDHYAGIDLDDCILPDGSLTDFAKDILSQVKSYTEISPSGKGLKIFCRCEENFKKIQKGIIEFYSHGQYFTVTGNHLEGTPLEIRDCTFEVLALVEQYSKPEKPLPEKSFNVKSRTASNQDKRAIYVRNLAKYGRAALLSELKALKEAPEHNRNNQLNKSAFNLGQLAGAQILDRPTVERELSRVGYEIGLEANEIRDTIKSGIESGLLKPRHVTTEFDVTRLPFFEISKPVALYFYMRQFLNRDSGDRVDKEKGFYKVPVWANLDKYYEDGKLCFARHQSSLAKLFNCTQQYISFMLNQLIQSGYIKSEETIKITMYDGKEQQIIIYSLGTTQITDSGEVIEEFYLSVKDLFV